MNAIMGQMVDVRCRYDDIHWIGQILEIVGSIVQLPGLCCFCVVLSKGK